MLAPILLFTLSVQAAPCDDALAAFTAARRKFDYAASEAAMQQAVGACGKEAKPADRAWMLENLADVQLHGEKWQAGLASAEACVAVESSNPSCHFYRWFALRQLKRWSDVDAEKPAAMKALQAFLAQKPDAAASPQARQRLASQQERVQGLYATLRRAADRQ